LDIPQLMRTCQISSLPEEALELYRSLETLARQFPGVPLIHFALEKAQTAKEEVAQAALDSFMGKMKWEDAGRTVNLLRLAGIHTEGEIRLSFVNGRRKKLRDRIALIPKSSPAQYADLLTKRYRDKLFNMVTLYRSLFRDGVDEDMALNLGFQWELESYCKVLKGLLNDIGNVDQAKSVMREVLFFADSMAKIGFDISAKVYDAFYESKWGNK
jgi:hypothetical protein